MQLSNFEIRIGNNPIDATRPPNTNGNRLCGAFPDTAGFTTPQTAFCPSRGRYVSVQRVGVPANGTWVNTMVICEVEVSLGKDAGYVYCNIGLPE